MYVAESQGTKVLEPGLRTSIPEQDQCVPKSSALLTQLVYDAHPEDLKDCWYTFLSCVQLAKTRGDVYETKGYSF